MKIHFAAIAADRARDADMIGAKLADAVQRADFEAIELIRMELVRLADDAVSLNVAEDVWRRVRSHLPDVLLEESLGFVLHKQALEAWKHAAEDEGETTLAEWLAAVLKKETPVLQFAD